MVILVTGCAGFIGFHLSQRLLKEGNVVIGVDNINDYYSISLKQARLDLLLPNKNFQFLKGDLQNPLFLQGIFEKYRPEVIIHLGAQAGVRYSLQNPQSYVDSNITGFLNILELSSKYKIMHLIYASSSSVYGLNSEYPFKTTEAVDHPVSIYAATKRTNELFAHTYSYLYALPTTGLRFFTVYGPWGRPDMALFKFTESIIQRRPIQLYNNGNMERDFTYIDDIVEAMVRVIPHPPNKGDKTLTPATSTAPFQLYNIGNNQPVKLVDFIEAIEDELGIDAIREYLPMQPGEVEKTYADVSDLYEKIHFRPQTTIKEGVNKFIEWYIDFYKPNLSRK